MSSGKIEDVINKLGEELKPVQLMLHPYVILAIIVFASIFYVTFVVSIIGVRHDLGIKIHETGYVYELAAAFSIFLSAGLAAVFAGYPDMYNAPSFYFIPVTLTGALFLWIAVRSGTEGVHMPHLHWDECFEDGLLLGLLPAAFLIFAIRRGRTTRPRLAMTMGMLSVTALCWGSLRITCSMDTVGHAFFYHVFPFVVLGGALGLLASRIFRW